MKTVTDFKRGCGYRKQGGLYLMADGLFKSCGKLPVPLDKCPCCGAGIKFTRGWTWITSELINQRECTKSDCKTPCVPFDGSVDKLGLLWIGKIFYPQASDFTRESLQLGVSRRIKAVPRGFKIGETWVALAHMKAINDFENNTQKAGIFTIMKPTRIEYIVRDTDTDEFLEGLEKRGITPVHVQNASFEQRII